MLGGIAPILIFNFPVVPKSPTFNAISGIPYIGDFVANNVGVPIPIYLDERLTGVYVENETKSIDIQTTVEAKTEAGTPDVSQRGLDSMVTINMLALKDSIVLSAILALCDMAFQKVVSREYNISYLNGATTIFGGLLHGFQTSVDSDNELIRITLQLSKANQNLGIKPGSTYLKRDPNAINLKGGK
jgi:hypothetical protein